MTGWNLCVDDFDKYFIASKIFDPKWKSVTISVEKNELFAEEPPER